MSVLKSKRKESPVKFLDTARELTEFSLRQCKKIQKSYTFYLAIPIFKLAQDVYIYVCKANAIYPSDEEKITYRRKWLTESIGTLNSLISQVQMVKELACSTIEDKNYVKWGDLIREEIRLIGNLIDSDKKRLSDS